MSNLKGIKTCQKIVETMRPLADWLRANRPATDTLTLKGPDYDTLEHYPKAAEACSVLTVNGVMQFSGYQLKRDKKPLKYET